MKRDERHIFTRAGLRKNRFGFFRESRQLFQRLHSGRDDLTIKGLNVAVIISLMTGVALWNFLNGAISVTIGCAKRFCACDFDNDAINF